MLRKIIKAKSGENVDVEIPDVMITTYQSCVAHENDRVAIKKLGVGYAIFDEGHMLKNMSTQRLVFFSFNAKICRLNSDTSN